jgi:DTW domain-containing protein
MLYTNICICSDIQKFDLKMRVTIMMHIKEIKKATNTGKLAKLMLTNSSIVPVGAPDVPAKREDIVLPGYENLILFPAATQNLDRDFLSTLKLPVNLIVLDGNYNQAGKMFRSELLDGVKRVRLPFGQKSNYELRHIKGTEKISTIEAIIKAIEIIEPGPAVEVIHTIFLKMVHDIQTKMGSY